MFWSCTRALAVAGLLAACTTVPIAPGSGGAASSSGATSSETSSTSASSTDTSGTGGGTSASTGTGGCIPSLEVTGTLPPALSQTGLYSDIANDIVATYVRAYVPLYPSFLDGTTIRRWVYVPECEQIDTGDMDTWQVPVGTRLWMEITTAAGVRVETRVILRTGPGDVDFAFGAYVWSGADATRNDFGVVDANGTAHNVPPKTQCTGCHRAPWKVLGFSAVQLSHNNQGATMTSLSNEGLLTVPYPAGIQLPGTPTEQAALGYLHANCGNCHFAGGVPNLGMRTRHLFGMTTVESTDTYSTMISVPPQMFACGGCNLVTPGDPAASAVVQRLSPGQMPPYGTESVDSNGAAVLAAWISSL